MDSLMIMLGWLGIFAPVALGAIGSIIGCARAGAAACGAMLETESGHGRFIGVSAMPSSQTIYGIVVMLTLNRTVTLINAPGLFAIGALSGVALMISAIYQGNACAASINVSKTKSEIFGLSIAPAAVVEGFAVFTFVFALLLVGAIPTGA
jgi:V/A-type H+/Na+-transporting ATPase subunit K